MERFTNFLQAKDLSKTTTERYVKHANDFLLWFKQDIENCTKKDILKYLQRLKNKHQQNSTRNIKLIALKHYFAFLVDSGMIANNPTVLLKIRGAKKKMLYHIFTLDELTQFADNYHHNFIRNFEDIHIKAKHKQSLLSRQRNYCMLGFLVYQGLHTYELQSICLDDIDFTKATLTIKESKNSAGRTLPLQASQIGALMNYIQNIRPQFFEYCNETEKLFFTLPEVSKRQTTTNSLMGTLKPFTKQVKTLDGNFLNFKQVRASVITYWLQTVGLRKTQYWAGHRHISSTERYLPNDLESLTEDIAKFNPF